MIGWIIAGVITVAVIAAFWDTISDFFKDTLYVAKMAIDEYIYASKAFVKKSADKIKVIIRHYYRKNGQEYEYKGEKEIPREEVPREFLEKAEEYEEYEITSELEMHL